MSTYNIYGLGNALVDIELEVTELELSELGIEKGMMTLVNSERQLELMSHFGNRIRNRACGGSGANSIIGATQMGAKCFYSCRVSNDDTGTFYAKDLIENGVTTNLELGNLPDGASGICLVLITPDAERTMNSFLGITGEFGIDDLDEAAIADSEWLYIEGYLASSESGRAAVKRAREIARANGVKIAMTFSDPAMVTYFGDGLLDLLGDGVDLLFCNEEEAMVFTKTDSVGAALEGLKAVSGSLALTVGKEGAVLFDGTSKVEVAGFPVQAVDTTGAGDAFAGVFLAMLCSGASFEDAGNKACLAASRVVSSFGPRLSKSALKRILT